jgi:hypothetical protein
MMKTPFGLRPGRCHLGEEGQAVLEGVLSAITLLIIIAACFFLFAWGSSLQHAHMGARVLAFRAAGPEVAWPRNPTGATTNDDKDDPDRGQKRWTDPDGYWNGSGGLLGDMIGLLNSEQSGTVTDRATGKVFILDPGRTTLGFKVHYVTASNPWRISRALVDGTFFLTAWFVGFNGKSLGEMTGQEGGPPEKDNEAMDLTKKAVKIP